MEQVLNKIIRAVFVGLILLIFYKPSAYAATADYQRCKTGENCTIGEFLYDDNYAPIATGSCTLTSRDPSGAVFINSATMSAQTDGWYSYTVDTASQTEGLYRSQMCCTETTNYLCLDKSFFIEAGSLSTAQVAGAVWNAQTGSYNTSGTFGKNLQNPVLTAASIWEYSNRTLTSFGSLVSDTWGYSTKTLSNFGTMIADFWGNGTRTLTGAKLGGGGELATAEDVARTSYSAAASVSSAQTQSNKNVVDVLAFGKEKEIIDFNLVIQNPAPVAQKVPFVYYFPPEVKKTHILKIVEEEVKKEDVIKIDEELQTNLNGGKTLGISTIDMVLRVVGEVLLPSQGAKKLVIKVKDVWQIAREEIETLRKQSVSLLEPLKNTSYFAEGATLKSEIDVYLDKALLLQKNFQTPEEKIIAFRSASVEVAAAKKEIENLKTVLASSGQTKTMFGFIGGVQTAGVWGMIIVFVAGFVFMTMYMKKLRMQEVAPAKSKNKTKKIRAMNVLQNHNQFINYFRAFHFPHANLLIIFYVFVMSLVIGGVIAAMIFAGNTRKVGQLDSRNGIFRPLILKIHK